MRIIMISIIVSMVATVLSTLVVPRSHQQIMPGQSITKSLSQQDELY